jgi:uncharacterized protein YqgC (DUF456 family)
MDVTVTVALIILGLILSMAGFVGCLVPVVPGPPMSYAALIILSLAKQWKPFSSTFLLVMAGLTLLAVALDYAVPAFGARRYGASKLGVLGAALGMILGLLAFPPFGMILGGMAGAVVGEFFAGKKSQEALRASWGVFIGTMVSIGLKLSLCAVMLFFYVKGIF